MVSPLTAVCCPELRSLSRLLSEVTTNTCPTCSSRQPIAFNRSQCTGVTGLVGSHAGHAQGYLRPRTRSRPLGVLRTRSLCGNFHRKGATADDRTSLARCSGARCERARHALCWAEHGAGRCVWAIDLHGADPGGGGPRLVGVRRRLLDGDRQRHRIHDVLHVR